MSLCEYKPTDYMKDETLKSFEEITQEIIDQSSDFETESPNDF